MAHLSPGLEGILKKLLGPLLFQIDVPGFRRQKIIASLAIDAIIDVGANKGQFGRELRRFGYEGLIISFEPLSSAYSALKRVASADSNWIVERCALGDRSGCLSLNIAENSQSSSLLQMLDTHVEAAPNSKYVGKEDVAVTTLEAIWLKHELEGKRTYLKIDTQGYELQILKGAEQILDQVLGLQLELSLTPLYENEATWRQMLDLLEPKFALWSLEQGFANPESGQQLQVDGVFYNRRLLS